MAGMKWSWADMEATPIYVRRYCLDLLGIKKKCDAEHARRRNR